MPRKVTHIGALLMVITERTASHRHQAGGDAAAARAGHTLGSTDRRQVNGNGLRQSGGFLLRSMHVMRHWRQL